MSYIRDKNYKVPEGFSPVLYGDKYGKDPLPVVGLCKLDGAGKYGRGIEFYIGDKTIPTLPLKLNGELWHKGWDIPTRWAIDASGKCWMDGAHGGCLNLVKIEVLLGEVEDQEERNYFRGILGMELEEPEWMTVAKTNDWGPNKDVFRKLVEIKAIIEEVFKDNQLPISAWDEYYAPFIDALKDIDRICETNDPLYQR